MLAGPLDVFVSRKRLIECILIASDLFSVGSKKLKPAPPAKPVGGFIKSGPSRLSDQPSSFRPRVSASPNHGKDLSHTEPRKSRFFASSGRDSRPKKTIPPTEEASIVLLWEAGDDDPDIDAPIAGPSRQSRSPSIGENIHSPSSCVSSLRAGSSPESHLSHLSQARENSVTSPAGTMLSSPPAFTPSQNDPFSSPRQKARLRSTSPVSPTRPSFRGTATEITATSSRSPRNTQSTQTVQVISNDALPRKDQFGDSPVVPGYLTHAFLSRPSAKEGKFANRQQLGTIGEASSDSFEEEQVVTPSNEGTGKRKNKDEEVDDEVEKRRAERAQAVALGWRKKYAYNAGMVSQSSAPKTMLIDLRQVIAGDLQLKHKTVGRPRVWPLRQQGSRCNATTPRILAERSMNIPLGTKADCEAPAAKQQSPISTCTLHELGELGLSSLTKYRFTGRVALDR